MKEKIKMQRLLKSSSNQSSNMKTTTFGKNQENHLNETPHKKKKIIISSIKKDPLDLLKDKIKNERDFIKKISQSLKVSKHCSLCQSLNISDNKEHYCTNFEALWYHRDTQFAHFFECSYKKAKERKIESSII